MLGGSGSIHRLNKITAPALLIAMLCCCVFAYAVPGGGEDSNGASVPLFFIYESDFYREGNVEYSFYHHGHFFGLGVTVAEEFETYAGYNI